MARYHQTDEHRGLGKSGVVVRRKQSVIGRKKGRIYVRGSVGKYVACRKKMNSPIQAYGKIIDITQDLYLRESVETMHAVSSGKASIAELKSKYQEFTK